MLQIKLITATLTACCAVICAGCGSAQPDAAPDGVWWPPEEPRQPGRLVPGAPDEPDPLQWWLLNIHSLVPPLVYSGSGQQQVADGIVEETNFVRARHGLAPVVRDERLDRVAQAHAMDCAIRDYWSHRTPEGLGSRERILAATGFGTTAGSENSAAWPPGKSTARQIVRAWELSPGHRELLLSPEVKFIGTGVYNYNDSELEHYVQLLVDFPQ